MDRLTDAEKKVVEAIRKNFFGEVVWSDCINESSTPSGIEGKALSGVVSSLTKKGIIECSGDTLTLI